MPDPKVPIPYTEEHIAELEAYYRERLESRGKNGSLAKALAINHKDKPLARLHGDAAPILARLMGGEKAKDVAASFGVSLEALCSWLLLHAPDEWRAIQAGKAQGRLIAAEDRIEGAEEMLDIAKGREGGKLATWTLERLLPKIYGQPDGSAGGVSITVNIDRSCDGTVTIDQSPDQS